MLRGAGLLAILACTSFIQSAARPFLHGIDANYLPEMRERGAEWRSGERLVDPLRDLSERGLRAFRVRVWTSNVDTALALAEECRDLGIEVHPVLFLSDGWADYVKQPTPEAWAGQGLEEKARAARVHAREVARALRLRGIRADLWAIGNEIDFGVCGEYEERWDRRFALDWMRGMIWPRAAVILAAAQAGVRDEYPRARFLVHATQWWNPGYVEAMLRALAGRAVRIDAVGLSYYPSAPMSDARDSKAFFRNAEGLSAALSRPVVVAEYAYPATSRIEGQFADWNREVAGYPMTAEGQGRWLRDFLYACRRSRGIEGAFYWSPEWHGDSLWSAFALFDETGLARPAWGEMRGER